VVLALAPFLLPTRRSNETMTARESRRTIIERADRLLKQSKTLRRLSDELLTESSDIRTAVNHVADKPARKGGRKKSSR
jgi:hypothetical protein